MSKPHVSKLLLHNFPENGVKFLLHNPGNLRDLICLLSASNKSLPEPDFFDFDKRTIEPDTLIRSDFSHGITDLLLKLPFRISDPLRASIEVYMLFEHLSGHQRHIIPRSLGYSMDAYRLQERRCWESKGSLHGFRYDVVVPIIIYTGERKWDAPTPFRDLINGGEFFAPFIPSMEPLFLSLSRTSKSELLGTGGAFGTVLHVLQHRDADVEEFQTLLAQATRTVEEQVPKDRHRLRELLAYLMALVYHFRKEPERADLREKLERSIQAQPIRREIQAMGHTIAEALREEGKLEGKLEGNREAKQQTLVLQLRRKFGRKVTPTLVTKIERTSDLRKLDEWLGNVLDADTLDAVGISSKK